MDHTRAVQPRQRARDAIRRDLINLLEEDPTFALPCSIHEIVQAELNGELVDLRTGQRRRVSQATPVAA